MRTLRKIYTTALVFSCFFTIAVSPANAEDTITSGILGNTTQTLSVESVTETEFQTASLTTEFATESESPTEPITTESATESESLIESATTESATEPESPTEPDTTKSATEPITTEPVTKDPATEKVTTPVPTTTAAKNGFYKENGKTHYYLNDVLQKGFLQILGKKYYFDANGNMVTGKTKIGAYEYYFDSNGVMKTGFVKINSKRYYYSQKTGRKLFGYRKIGKYRYYFKKKTGEITTGFVTKKGIRTYYDKKGRLKIGSFKVSHVKYIATKKSGKIYSVRNLADVICQRPQLPTGCEITSWTMMANYAGVKISKTSAANIMPKSSNPNLGFMGSPYSAHGKGLVVYPNGLKSMTKKYLGSYVNMTGCSIKEIKSKLQEKHLVMVWVNNLDGFASHTVALTGYDKTGFFYNDPWTGTKRKISYQSFLSIWSGNAKRAMSY